MAFTSIDFTGLSVPFSAQSRIRLSMFTAPPLFASLVNLFLLLILVNFPLNFNLFFIDLSPFSDYPLPRNLCGRAEGHEPGPGGDHLLPVLQETSLPPLLRRHPVAGLRSFGHLRLLCNAIHPILRSDQHGGVSSYYVNVIIFCTFAA